MRRNLSPASLPKQEIFCATDKPLYLSRTVVPVSNGNYSDTNLPCAVYTLGIKGDRYGQLWGDYDFLQGGAPNAFPVPDSVGAFGQFGSYTELESRVTALSSPLILASDGYYDPIAGRPFVRQRGLQNEYEFQLFFYDSMAGFGKGLANAAWQKVIEWGSTEPEGFLRANGISPKEPKCSVAGVMPP